MYAEKPDAVHAILPLVPKKGEAAVEDIGIGAQMSILSVGGAARFLESLSVVRQAAGQVIGQVMRKPV